MEKTRKYNRLIQKVGEKREYDSNSFIAKFYIRKKHKRTGIFLTYHINLKGNIYKFLGWSHKQKLKVYVRGKSILLEPA